MTNTFEIEFHDKKKILFSDIIEFEGNQIEEIKDIALGHIQKELIDWKMTGIPLQNGLTNDQEYEIVALKNRVVNGQTANQLIKKKLIKVLPHALKQLLERPKKGQTLNDKYVVEKLIPTDRVKKALFKGHPQLSYTMFSQLDSDQFEIPISFVVKKGLPTKVLIITVFFAESKNTHTVNNIGEGDKNKEVLMELYLKMIKKGNK